MWKRQLPVCRRGALTHRQAFSTEDAENDDGAHLVDGNVRALSYSAYSGARARFVVYGDTHRLCVLGIAATPLSRFTRRHRPLLATRDSPLSGRG